MGWVMLEYIILTIWVEYNDKLHEHYKLTPYSCESAVEKLYEEYKDKPTTLIAVKCDSYTEFEVNKPLIELYRENN